MVGWLLLLPYVYGELVPWLCNASAACMALLGKPSVLMPLACAAQGALVFHPALHTAGVQ
jgi:hypothetical protein